MCWLPGEQHSNQVAAIQPPRAPQELVDEIIDILAARYQRTEINACSLVCRAWLPRCRAFIHSSIRLDYSSKIENLCKLYTSSPELAGHVKSLCIDVCEESGEPATKHPWINASSVLELLKALRNVERLSLEGISWTQMEPETREAIFGYKRVKDLWLATCDFPEPLDLVHLLRAYPKLESARMEGVSADEDIDITERFDEKAALKLKWLDVGDLCNRPDVVIQWAIGHNRPSIHIDNIHVTWGNGKPTLVGKLLELAGPSVQTLSVTFDGSIYSEGSIIDMLMPQFTNNLRTFRILARLEKCIDDPNLDVEWISNCIAHLASTTLKIVRVQLEVKEISQATRLRWDIIDGALAEKPGLNKVEVCIFRRWDRKGEDDVATLNHIKKAMPKLAARGFLEVMQQWT